MGSGKVRTWFTLALALLLLACGDDDGAPEDAGNAEEDAGVPEDAPVDAGSAVDAFLPPGMETPLPLTQHVNPFVGSGGLAFGVGSSSVAPQTPFGMARPAPDTSEPDGAPGFNHCSGYYWEDELIQGFSQVRMHGTGIADYGNVALMPVDGISPDKTVQTGYREPFSHDEEEAEVGYYAVTLGDSRIRAELTASDRVAIHRYTFPESVAEPVVLVDVAHWIGEGEVVDADLSIDPEAREVSGFSQVDGGYSGRFGGVRVYFVARFDRAFTDQGTWFEGALRDELEVSGSGNGQLGGWVGVDGDVTVAVGLSFVDVEHARMNLDAEGADFDATREATQAQWEEVLGRVEVEARSERDLRLFYTALYHALLMPTLGSDVDGSYRGLDGEVRVAEGYRYYTDFSLWDTFRTQVPLLSWFYPELQRDQMRSLVAMARDGGFMPRWPLGHGYTGGMVGESATVAMADAWIKGVRDFDLRAAYDAMRFTAMQRTPEGSAYGGRSGVEDYVALGYVPVEAGGGSVSKTLEYAYDDWALAYLAEELGETGDAAAFTERAGNWENLWDEERQFLLGRQRDGAFVEDVDLVRWESFYTEGNAWQYLWYAPHDLEGLAERMGGPDAMMTRLDEFFVRSARRPSTLFPPNDYWHGNEPDIHAPWIFSAFDRRAESARWVRWVMETFYSDTPEGLPGNDDSGTLSAWYVFAALGVFPIAGGDLYLLTEPTLASATIHGERELVIEGSRDAEGITLDGEPLERSRLRHAQLEGTLRFGLTQ